VVDWGNRHNAHAQERDVTFCDQGKNKPRKRTEKKDLDCVVQQRSDTNEGRGVADKDLGTVPNTNKSSRSLETVKVACVAGGRPPSGRVRREQKGTILIIISLGKMEIGERAKVRSLKCEAQEKSSNEGADGTKELEKKRQTKNRENTMSRKKHLP